MTWEKGFILQRRPDTPRELVKKSEEGSASMSGAGAKIDLGGQVKTREKTWI